VRRAAAFVSSPLPPPPAFLQADATSAATREGTTAKYY
jgi:hypothetical protein